MVTSTLCLAPEFVVRGLEAGMDVTLKVRATNHRGQSVSISLAADIMKVAEKRMGECRAACRLTSCNAGPPAHQEGRPAAPVVGAVVAGGCGLGAGSGGSRAHPYTHRSRPHSHSKCDSPPTLTNVYGAAWVTCVARTAHETPRPEPGLPTLMWWGDSVCSTFDALTKSRGIPMSSIFYRNKNTNERILLSCYSSGPQRSVTGLWRRWVLYAKEAITSRASPRRPSSSSPCFPGKTRRRFR
ncbi:hypothetical protein GWK47_023522 [Chionoecetes opilio]|uniref:Uncharacterized protein n=1 Tax=Chionoecetes opilio TaxID=41210 RepID=A0A8J5CGE4_CHIOP|nr:hypothetical protein GWK47_023522 [Chionoecetes opilio]